MQYERHLLSLLLVAASSLLGSSASPAVAQPLGPEFQVNSYTTGTQNQPTVAAVGSGGFVVTWASCCQDGSNYGVFGQRFEPDGLPVGSEFRANTFTTGTQDRAAVAGDDSGDFVVVWESQDQDGSDEGVFGQRFESAGLPVGGEFQVNSYTTGPQNQPAVAVDGSGKVVVAWQSWWQDQNQFLDVFGQRFDSGGLPLGGEFQVNSHSSWYESSPGVAADSAGNFVVVWGVFGGDGFNVSGRRFDSAGVPAGIEFQINSYTAGYPHEPAVAIDGSSNSVAVWRSDGQDGWDHGVFGQQFDSASVPVGSEFQVNTYTFFSQRSPAVAADGQGNFVVVWRSQLQDGSSFGVFGQRFDGTGRRVGNEFRANTYTTGHQGDPAVAALGSERFVVVWESEGQDGSATGVFGRFMTFPYFYDGFESGDFGGWSSVCNDGDVCP